MFKISKRFICALIILAALICTAFSIGVSAESKTHTVVSGETIWEIAQRYEISVKELMKANTSIKDKDYIEVGDKILIPEATPLSTLENEVIKLVNEERAKYGLPALEKNIEISRLARTKAHDMIDNDYFSHNSPTYGSPFNMMEHQGLKFSSAAENIGMGQKTAVEIMKAWMDSPGHRANILSRTVTHIGVGAAKAANGTLYWSQLFIKPY
jgi:uncharacterized YkwD family protein